LAEKNIKEAFIIVKGNKAIWEQLSDWEIEKVKEFERRMLMRFDFCLLEMLRGSKCRRSGWPDKNTHIAIINKELSIWDINDKQYHPLIVTVEDILVGDWMIYESPVPFVISPDKQIIVSAA